MNDEVSVFKKRNKWTTIDYVIEVNLYVVYLGLYKCFLSISASIFPVIAGAPNIEEKILADVARSDCLPGPWPCWPL